MSRTILKLGSAEKKDVKEKMAMPKLLSCLVHFSKNYRLWVAAFLKTPYSFPALL